jgi:hypothetical protein
MRTSNDAERLLPRAKQDDHHVLDQIIRGSHPEAICVSDAFSNLSQFRAFTAQCPRTVMH